MLLYGTLLAGDGPELKIIGPLAEAGENRNPLTANKTTQIVAPGQEELIEDLKKALELRGESKSPLFIISL